MTDEIALPYECGCLIHFISYGVIAVDLCSKHKEQYKQLEEQEK